MAGLVTEVCPCPDGCWAHSRTAMRVYFVSDASGRRDERGARGRKRSACRWPAAKPINWMALTGEWAPYWASQERAVVSFIDSELATTTSSLLFDWINDQVKARDHQAPGHAVRLRAEVGAALRGRPAGRPGGESRGFAPGLPETWPAKRLQGMVSTGSCPSRPSRGGGIIARPWLRPLRWSWTSGSNQLPVASAGGG